MRPPPKTVQRPFERLGARLPSEAPDGERKPAPEPLPPAADDEELLAWAMRDVVPLPQSAERVSERAVDPRPIPDDDAEAYEELRALVDGRVRFNLSDSDEWLEGAAEGIGPRVMSKLRRGSFAIQDYLDLHGMTKTEAREELERFVERCGASGKRSVLVIHGRGHNSRDKIPVLKHGVNQWLVRGRLARWTLAYCTARSVHGGAGALYVLLRARPAPK